MTKQTKQPEATISDVLEYFDNGLLTLLGQVSEHFAGKIVRGYRSQDLYFEKHRITAGIQDLNLLIENYLSVFPSLKPSRETLDEIVSQNADTVEQVEINLKLKYIKDNEIEIPNFPNYKRSKLIEAYDFPTAVESGIKLISTTLQSSKDLIMGKRNLFDYFNQASGFFEFSDDAETELVKKFTMYASDEEISEVVSLNMFCIGLSNLKSPGYSFKELPEIDHRLMKMIKIKRDDIGREREIVVDIDRINNPQQYAEDPRNGPTITQHPQHIGVKFKRRTS